MRVIRRSWSRMAVRIEAMLVKWPRPPPSAMAAVLHELRVCEHADDLPVPVQRLEHLHARVRVADCVEAVTPAVGVLSLRSLDDASAVSACERRQLFVVEPHAATRSGRCRATNAASSQTARSTSW